MNNEVQYPDVTELDEKVKNVLNKLISEEMIANNQYRASIAMCKIEDVHCICQLFKDIADDELFDHHQNLIRFAMQHCWNDNSYTYDFPIQEKEYKKFADKRVWKLYDSMEKNKDVLYYVNLAIEAEKLAIESYSDALKMQDELPYELYSIVQSNYYDEIEHLENLNTLKISIEAAVDLTWTVGDDTSHYEVYPDYYWW